MAFEYNGGATVNYYKVWISCMDMYNSKEITIVRYFKAKDILEAYESGSNDGKTKGKYSRKAVLLVKPIDEKEYIIGKSMERFNKYLYNF
ncbi:hypothetical protein TKV_c11200 [Thermoanaerobacter kivui]|uniref:Uncharacterized protein n=1 Tax=Thermoanaerobacter kivui TaxID=2325 RepID=A0A097AR55_THEKI|nr:hypothetical protein TKV_c11200 [Thermoanaerobacter kivui]